MKYTASYRWKKDNPPPKKYGKEILESQILDKIGELVFEQDRGVICIGELKEYTFPVFGDNLEMETRVEFEVDYAHSIPVLIHGGYEYQKEAVRPPYELSFVERLKFVFTGKYPH